MTTRPSFLDARVSLIAFVLFTMPLEWAQQTPAAPGSTPTPSSSSGAPSAKTFSQQDLDQILAPVALYPDALLAQIFMASTYPLEIVEAARWVKENPQLKDKALEEALQKQSWDPSVKSLTTVPLVLEQMNTRLDWTQKLGDAFLAQQKEILDTVQSLRAKAYAAGNLKSSDQQTIRVETQGDTTIYIIESPQPEVVYVPTYNPYVVYGTWWYPYPPYYMYPPAYVYPPGVVFAAGIIVGAAIWGNCNWHGGTVNVHVSHYNSFNRTNINNPNWNHNVDHRKGVAYKDPKVAQRYNRGTDTADSREQFRGRADSGRAELQGMDRDQLQRNLPQEGRGAGSRDRAGADTSSARTSATNRDIGSSAASRGDYGGFSGAGGGASARAASSRGGASMGGRGGGRR